MSSEHSTEALDKHETKEDPRETRPQEEAYEALYRARYRVRDQFSMKWAWRIGIPYAIWYIATALFLILSEKGNEIPAWPLAIMVASPTIIALTVLTKTLGGINQKERDERDPGNETQNMAARVFRGTSGDGTS